MRGWGEEWGLGLDMTGENKGKKRTARRSELVAFLEHRLFHFKAV